MSNRFINYCDPKRVIRSLGYARSGVHKSTLVNNSATARFVFMSAPGSVAQFKWSNFIDSDLKSYLYYTRGLTALWPHYRNNQLLQVCNATPTNVISQYDYGYDVAGRRISCAKSGSAFAQDDTVAYGYNARSELTNAVASVDSDYRYAYDFDDIGNREATTEFGTNHTYAANRLNQYTSISNFASSASFAAEFVPQFDDDGNQTLVKTATGVWQVQYNGENRPVLWECVSPNSSIPNSSTPTLLSMSFDRMGRRVAKNNQRFVYDGYLQIANFELQTPNSKLQTFIWDPTESTATRPLAWLVLRSLGEGGYYTHDGNKNVSEVVAENGETSAHYEYAPFGEVRIVHGECASDSPWRFSSEYAEDDSATIYYNYRHYEPVIGRWLRRDPIAGVVELLYVNNAPVEKSDCLGLKTWRNRQGGGCKFEDIDAEAKRALKVALEKMNSSAARHEWFGSVCCKCEKGSFLTFYTGPFEGKTMTRMVKTRVGVIVESYEYSPQKAAFAQCPEGSKLVGYYHTHPDGKNLSKHDKDFIRGEEVPLYMAKDDSQVQIAEPMRTDDPKKAGYTFDKGDMSFPAGIPIDPQVTTQSME